MKLKLSLIIAIFTTLFVLVIWESFWRSKGYYPNINDDKSLWSMERKKVKKATLEDFIILGSSRAFFDIQVQEWKKQTGRFPTQLASTGSSPLPTFHDIVNNTDFRGTVLIGVAPNLFFSTINPKAFPWRRAQSKVDYFKKETYAQKLNFRLSIPLQKNFAFISADEEEWYDDIDLKALLNRIEIGNRTNDINQPAFYNFGDVSIPRNMSLTYKTEHDKGFAQKIIDVWNFERPEPPKSEDESMEEKEKKDEKPKWPDIDGTLAYFLKDLEKFKKRNGKVVLVRCPSNGIVRQGEIKEVPRKQFWDSLVNVARVPNYHFEDYVQFKDLICPEESHLSKDDADYFTRELVNLFKKDKILTESKTN